MKNYNLKRVTNLIRNVLDCFTNIMKINLQNNQLVKTFSDKIIMTN